MFITGSDLSMEFPLALDYGAMSVMARRLLPYPAKQPFQGSSEVLNCATAACQVLGAGGIRIERRASLAPIHPLYSVLYRHGVRAAQLGPNGDWGQQLSFRPLQTVVASPDPGRSLYLYQRIWKTPGATNTEDIAPPDLAERHTYIEHILPLWWESHTAMVFDVRSQANRILALASYLAEEQDTPNVLSYLAELPQTVPLTQAPRA